MSTRFCKASRHFFLVAYFSGLRQEKPIPWPEYRQRKEGKNILKYKLFKPTTKSPAVWCIIFLQRAPLAGAKVSCCAVIKKLATISERKHTTVAICCVASVAHLACEKSNKITCFNTSLRRRHYTPPLHFATGNFRLQSWFSDAAQLQNDKHALKNLCCLNSNRPLISP